MNIPAVTLSFVFFLGLFTLVGVAAKRRRKTSSEDYLVASRDINPWLTALSAVSTNNSGYMFIGLIGFTWRQGFEALWISLGWIVGDWITWLWVQRRVRERSEEIGASSVPTMLATDEEGVVRRPVAIGAALLTLVFLSTYAAAQLNAGGTALQVLFGWPIWVGAVIGVAIVTAYCISGGLRASIWTDAVQAVVMLVSMALLLAVCVAEVGGFGALTEALRGIDPSLVEFFPSGAGFGFATYFVGFVFGGAAVIGQPHILVRFMAMDAPSSIPRARKIYFTWFTLFSAAAFLVGLYARALMPGLTEGLDADAAVVATEGALPALSVMLLPPILVGVMLAGLFSATMSTADSQLLSCSAALTQDLFPNYQDSYRASKVATLLVAAFALMVALNANEGVFALVLIAWSALGASIGPVLIVRLAGARLPDRLALVMMSAGILTVIGWGHSPWAGDVFKALPGMLVPMAIYLLARPFLR